MSLKRTFNYIAQAMYWRKRGASGCSVGELMSFYPRWRHSQRSGTNALDDAIPWMAFSAIRCLEGLLRPEMRVFEYGCGGSTMFFQSRVREVVSVEHDEAWANRVREMLERKRFTNVKLFLRTPKEDAKALQYNPSDPDGYVSDDERYHSCSFRDYVTAIENYPAGHFDLIIVDGRARPSCIKHAAMHIKVGGHILLDNSERSYYDRATTELNERNWRKRVFAGPLPYQGLFSETTVWERIS